MPLSMWHQSKHNPSGQDSWSMKVVGVNLQSMI